VIARLYNRRGICIEWRRVEEIKDGVAPPEAIMAGKRVFVRWDIHPIQVEPGARNSLTLMEANRKNEFENELSYVEVTCASPPFYWE
jgi:hypothetical protein